MSCKVVVGNFLDDDLAFTLANSNTFDDDLGADYAHDGPGKLPAAFPSDSPPGDPIVDFSLNLVRAAAANWTAAVGTVEDSADQDHGFDATSLKVLVASAHIDSAELVVRSGYSYWIEGWAFGSGTGPTGKISLYNPNTKRWWDGTAWVDSIAYLATSAAAAWVGIGSGAGVRVDVEAASATLSPTTTLQVQLWRIDNSTADPVYFDDIFLYAGVDFVGIMGGHNVPAWVPVEWRVVTSAGVQTLQATFTKARNQFWLTQDSLVFAYEHIIKFDIGGGTIDPAIYFGDLVVGQSVALSKTPHEPIQLDYDWKGQARMEAPGGTRYIANRGPSAPRRLTLQFRFASAAQEGEALAVWIEQVRGGEQPVCVMPSTEKFPNLLIYGEINPSAGLSVSLQGATQYGNASGDLAGSGSTQDHYSDLTVVIDEGASFQLDD